MASCDCNTVAKAFGQRLPLYWDEYTPYWRKVLSDAQTTITVQVRRNTAGTVGTVSLTCHKAVADNLKAVFAAIFNVRMPGGYFYVKDAYMFSPRQMNSGKKQKRPLASIHSTGLAIDINAIPENNLGAYLVGAHATAGDDCVHMRTTNHPVVRIFQSAGWTWGGAWSNRDYMHFEYTSGNLPDGSWKADMVNWGSGIAMFGQQPTLADCPIDLMAVVRWSRDNCHQESQHKCAEYVKKAFEAGGCVYVSGNGFENQPWCERNGFVCIGDFNPIEGCPRPTASRGIQFPMGYVQQIGDVCLMTHAGGVGHMVYATGPGIDDWCSDFWQKPPGQRSGMGPYCYQTGVSRVQFWRHKSILHGLSETFTVGFGYIQNIINALELVKFPEFQPETITPVKIKPDDPRNWIDHDFDITDPVEERKQWHEESTADRNDYIVRRTERVTDQQHLGYDVDYDTNVLITGPKDKK